MTKKLNSHDAIVWIDVETTGLDFKKEALLELAVVITDKDLNILDSYSNLIKTPKRKLRRMNEYVLKMHTDSELIEDIKQFARKPIAEVEAEILELLDRNGLKKGLLLGGASVHFDRRMLESRMPRLMARFTHQNLDVSSIGLVVKRWTPGVYEQIKRESDEDPNPFPHRAWYDILATIELLKTYRRFVFTDEAEKYLVASTGE